MDLLERHALDRLTIDDEGSFRHVGLYDRLKAALLEDDVHFHVAKPGSPVATSDHVLLLNLAFWDPKVHAEVLVDDVLSADMLMHNAWHHVGRRALGADAQSGVGLLFVEAVASAFDVYLVGRVLGRAVESLFLDTQVPAMAEAAAAAGLDDAGFEAMLERWAAEPEACFEALRGHLFDVARGLLASESIEAAAAVLADHAAHPMAPLLHHFELPGWVLFARAHGAGDDGAAARVHALDAALRDADDSLAVLAERWL